ncbi:MAG: amino acid permease [Bacteroidota bacterium]|nr:amino acid permease [Bacteroidota bacterium]
MSSKESTHLNKKLGVRDLTGFGIAAIIGAGIFSTIGRASFEGGPAVIFLFLFTALACAFTAFAYAEFASLIPVSGSAYTYSYVVFGELFAWVIGWALIMEYAIGNIVVAISWSDYFTNLLNSIPGIHVSEWMTMDYFSAKEGYDQIITLIQNGHSLEQLTTDPAYHYIIPKYLAFAHAPTLFGIPIVLDVFALLITFTITALVYRGINESRKVSNIMVLVKVVTVLLVIIVGAFYINTDNWNPFAPNGFGGVLAGISSIFFAYIGFDAISTTAEECKNPQRDLPRGIFWSIIICTILYIAITLTITGLVHHSELNVGDPLAYVFSKISDLKWLSGVIAISAVVAMASVFIVFQLGQPRIWMTMSRDGLLPKNFSNIHPKYKTPSYATIVTGIVVATPILFTNLETVVDACSIGTLFAFILVCAGILRLESRTDLPRGKFKTPYINSRYAVPIVFTLIAVIIYSYFSEEFIALLSNNPIVIDNQIIEGYDAFIHRLPMWIFIIISLSISSLAIIRQMSFIPLAGMLSCFYMMAQMGLNNWIMFLIWLSIGLLIYFLYGYRHSKLRKKEVA